MSQTFSYSPSPRSILNIGFSTADFADTDTAHDIACQIDKKTTPLSPVAPRAENLSVLFDNNTFLFTPGWLPIALETNCETNRGVRGVHDEEKKRGHSDVRHESDEETSTF